MVDRQILAFRPFLSPVPSSGTQRDDLGCVCALASSAAGTDRSARDTFSCEIYALSDCHLHAATDLDVDATADLDVHATPNFDPAASDSAGDYCGGGGRQAGVAVTR